MDDVDMRKTVGNHKLISVLHELSKENFSVSDDTILDKLYVHIENSEIVKDNLHSLLPGIGHWLEVIVNKWDKNDFFYGVKIFTVRFIGFIGSSPKGFSFLYSKNVLLHIHKLASSMDTQNDSCLMVPLINSLRMFLSLKEGWIWISESKIWRYAIKALYESHSMYTRREGVKFISLLLTTSTKYDSDIGVEVLHLLCEPLVLNHFLTVETNNGYAPKPGDQLLYNGGKVTITNQLTRAAKCLCDVLDELLSNKASIPGKLSLVFRNLDDVYGSLLISDILSASFSPQAYETFSLLLLLVDISNAVKSDCKEEDPKACLLDTVYSHAYWVIKSMTSQSLYNAALSFCVTCLSWRSKIYKNSCSLSCGMCSQFESAIVYCLRIFLHLHSSCFCTRPCACKDEPISRSRLKTDISSIGEDLYKKVLSDCLAHCNDNTQKLSLQYIQLGVLGITRSLNFITCYENRVSVFSDVLTTLETMVKYFDSNQDAVRPVLLHLLTLASKMIEVFRFTYWKINEENNENLFLIIIKILGIDCYDVRVFTTSLQILNKILKFHIMPDLLCKVEKVKDIDVRLQLCNLSMLVFKLSSRSWEIRDTTLEVFQTMIELAELTPWFFIDPFQTDLLNKIFLVASTDESAYVRASALNFFSRVVRAKFFSDIISPSSLCDLAINTLLEDEMPATRRAACFLITALYVTYVPKILIDARKMYEAVYVTILKDLDWEVTKAAVMFWQCTVDKHLMDEGIPLRPSLLCFSKASTTTTQDTNSRILSVFNTLSEIGCLKAIWLSINDESNISVSQEARNIVNNIEALDNQWDFIDKILNMDDSDEKVEVPNHKLTSKKFFTLIRNQSWRETLDSRIKWIENTCDDLFSLLDHILNADNRMDDCDYNTMDCY